MDTRFLIKNGMVVDGTGRAAYAADVRVRGGSIAQIGQGLAREGREGDFTGRFPGRYIGPGKPGLAEAA